VIGEAIGRLMTRAANDPPGLGRRVIMTVFASEAASASKGVFYVVIHRRSILALNFAIW
jgi:hypothetical protein